MTRIKFQQSLDELKERLLVMAGLVLFAVTGLVVWLFRNKRM